VWKGEAMALFRPRKYFRPATIKEALLLLDKYGGRAKPIAGGTDLLVAKPRHVEYLVDISRLPLSYIKSDDNTLGINIGALTTLRNIETCKLFEDENFKVFSILADVAHKMGYATTRNIATIGGNVCNAVPSADFPPILIALNAEANIASLDGERKVPIEEFITGVRNTVLKSNELLIEIQLPQQPPYSGAAFLKLGRVNTDIALVNVAVRVTINRDKTCKDIRIVLGAVGPTPIRVTRAENLLKGKKIEDSAIKKVSDIASEDIKPISDVRASAEYRREVSKVLVERALKQAFNVANERVKLGD
jgi:carbon-monoxide dehydrogenase medium subunit